MARDIFQTTIVRRHPDSGLLEPLADVDVFLFAPGSVDPASAQMYQSGDSGSNAQYPNPLTTGANGLIEFYADVGAYDVRYEDPLGRIAPRTFRWNSLPAADNSIPNDLLMAVGKDALSALVQQMLWDVGDLKHIAYDLDVGSEPAGWAICKGQAVARAGAYAPLWEKIRGGHAGTPADPAPWGNGDGVTTFNVPDLQGRVLVGKGSIAEINAIGKNEGLAAGARKMRHRHGKGNISSTGGNHAHPNDIGAGYQQPAAGGGPDVAFPNMVGGVTLTFTNASGKFGGNVLGATHTHPNSDFGGEVGDTSGPLDTNPFSVVNHLIKL